MKSKKLIIGGGIGVAMAVCIGVAMMNKPDTEANIGGNKEGTRVTVEYVKKQDIETKISSSGKLEAVNTKTIYLDATNKIAVLHKEVGDEVKAGEVVITLDEEVEIKVQNQIEALEKQLLAEKEALNQLMGKGSTGEILSATATLKELKDTKKNTEQNIANAKTELENLNKDLEEAEKDLATNKELLEVGAVSQNVIDDLETSIDKIKQSIERQESSITLSEQSISTIDTRIQTAQYNLDLLQNKVSDSSKKQQIAARESSIKNIENQITDSKSTLVKSGTEIVAPIDGVITYLPEEEGVTVPAGSKLVSVVDPSQLKVECEISPYYSADLRLDLDAIIKYTGSKTIEVLGKVSKISAVANVEQTASGESVVLPVEVVAIDPSEIIKPGFSVDVKIITDTRDDVCVVPILAIDEEDDTSYVYVVKEDGTLEKREVVQGLSNGLNIEVSNVQEGEMIVNVVEDYITDGMAVSYEKIGEIQ